MLIRVALARLVTPESRSAPMASLRKVAMARGAALVRSREASLAKVVSRTWWSLFLDRPLTTHEHSDVGGARLVGFETGHGVDGFTALLPPLGLAAPMEFDRGDRPGEGQAAGDGIDSADLDRVGLVSAVRAAAGPIAGADVDPRQALELAVQVLLPSFDDRDGGRAFVFDQPPGLLLDRVERIEGDYRVGQVQPGQQRFELTGLVGLAVHIALRERHRLVMVDRGQQMDPAAVRVA